MFDWYYISWAALGPVKYEHNIFMGHLYFNNSKKKYTVYEICSVVCTVSDWD